MQYLGLFFIDVLREVSVLCEPLLVLNGNPPSINGQRDNAQESPKDFATEQLPAGAVKLELIAVNVGVFCIPSLPLADDPRSSDTQGNDTEQGVDNASPNNTPKSACKFRFHNNFPFLKLCPLLCVHLILSHPLCFVNAFFGKNSTKNIFFSKLFVLFDQKCPEFIEFDKMDFLLYRV